MRVPTMGHRSSLWVTIATILALLEGCSTPVRVQLINNTANANSVSYRSTFGVRTHAIPPRETSEFESAWFHLIREDCVLKYEVRGLPTSEFVEVRDMQRHLTVQLEPDWRAFIVRAHDAPPIEVESYPQPPGFPLTAIEECDE